MNNFQITHCLTTNKLIQKKFHGVYAANHLANIKINNGICIANTAHSSSKGEHWVCFYINNNFIEVFDSSGTFFLKNKYFKKFIKLNGKNKTLKYNSCIIQHPKSNICGYYCCMFALFKSQNKSFDTFMKLFTKTNLLLNDKKIEMLFKKYFKLPICNQTNKKLYVCK